MLGTDPFAPERWATPEDGLAALSANGQPAKRPRRPSRRGPFIKGPVYWPWLQTASALPGKALYVGLMLWRESGIVNSYTVHFCQRRAVADGVPWRTVHRAILTLEHAGLISVHRRPGRGLEVTLLQTGD